MSEPVSIVISGAQGRMGRTVARLAREDARFELLGGIERAPLPSEGVELPRLSTPEDAGSLLEGAEVIIDFSAPAFLGQLLREHAGALRGRGLVVGTTGLGAAEHELLERASRESPVLLAANFSIGVNLLLALAERAARSLGEGYDIEIVEMHHRLKEDAPSGTALALGEAVSRGRGIELEQVRRDGRSGRPGARPAGEIGMHAVRGGDIIGEHTVYFIGDRERIELSHRASDRALFAEGALRAAAWLRARAPGRYTMADVLDL